MNFADAESHKSEQDRDADGAMYKIQEIVLLRQEIDLIMDGIKTGLLLPDEGLKLTFALQSMAMIRV